MFRKPVQTVTLDDVLQIPTKKSVEDVSETTIKSSSRKRKSKPVVTPIQAEKKETVKTVKSEDRVEHIKVESKKMIEEDNFPGSKILWIQ